MTVYQEIFEVIKQRKADYEAGKAQENSYTAYLFDKGVDKICKKVGEEATETVIAAKNGDNDELFSITLWCLRQIRDLSGLTLKRYLTRETKR